MSTLRLMVAGCILWLISIGAVIADSPEEISWRVDDAVLGTSAVSMSENSCFKLYATIGQPIAGTSAGSGFELSSGILAVSPAAHDDLFRDSFEGCLP